MNWPQIYLACFFLGLLLSAVALLSGRLHLPFHPHLPGFHPAHPPVHPPSAGSVSAASHGASALNFFTMTVFLTWFGGCGYLLTRYSHWLGGVILVGSFASGLAGAILVFGFVAKILLGHEKPLLAADFEMSGVLGKITVRIRAGGTGELVYSQEGTRRSCGARSDTGEAIEKGTEVVVTRYEKVIAYVKPWLELEG